MTLVFVLFIVPYVNKTNSLLISQMSVRLRAGKRRNKMRKSPDYEKSGLSLRGIWPQSILVVMLSLSSRTISPAYQVTYRAR